MNTNAAVTAVQELVAPLVAADGLYLENVQLKRAGKYSTLIVTVDLEQGPGAVGSAQLEAVSREISAALDASDPISGAYTLEVSTPGAERELTEERHYSRAIGRMVHFVLRDGSAFVARLLSHQVGSGVTVATYTEKKKQLVETGERNLTFSEIARARIVVEI